MLLTTGKSIENTEVDPVIADPTKTKTQLGWNATPPLDEMIRERIEADLKVMHPNA